VRTLRGRRVERHSLLRIQIEVQHPQRLAVLNLETGRAELHRRDGDAASEVPVSSRHVNAFSDEEAPQAP